MPPFRMKLMIAALFCAHTYAWPPLIHLNEDQLVFFKCINNASTTAEKEYCVNLLPDQDKAYVRQKLIEMETANDETQS